MPPYNATDGSPYGRLERWRKDSFWNAPSSELLGAQRKALQLAVDFLEQAPATPYGVFGAMQLHLLGSKRKRFPYVEIAIDETLEMSEIIKKFERYIADRSVQILVLRSNSICSLPNFHRAAAHADTYISKAFRWGHLLAN